MPQELRNYIRVAELVPVEEISSATNGTAIDMYLISGTAGHHFDSAYVRAGVGELGTDVTSVKVKIEEADNSNFSDATVASGGEEQTVGENAQAIFQVQRSKRYIRAVFTPVESVSPSGTPGEDSALVYATSLLTNWAVPMPLMSATAPL